MIINSTYNLIESLSHGSFGSTFVAEYIPTNTLVALKVEKEDVKPSQILKELKIYQLLGEKEGFPAQYGIMLYKSQRVMGMELLGANLFELFIQCKKKFSLKTVIMIALQMLDRLEALHSIGYIHRDIKPQNIMIGRAEKSHILFLTDFGLSTQYSRSSKETVLPPLLSNQVTGNALFASVGSHLNYEPSPKDDLESLGYMLAYLLNGKLPWSGINTSDPQKKANIITNTKMTSSIYNICGDAPEELATFLRHVKELKQSAMPDYNQYREIFIKLYRDNEFPEDNVYDWTNIHKEVVYQTKKRSRRTI